MGVRACMHGSGGVCKSILRSAAVFWAVADCSLYVAQC